MMNKKALLDKLHHIHENRPPIHRPVTERASETTDSRKFWGVTKELIEYIVATVDDTMTTAETGCGISTLAFSSVGAKHTSVTPDSGEELAIRKEAEAGEISLSKTRFCIGPSEDVLPGLEFSHLSVALIDGKHAFPWPMIDWFYFARAMKKGSIIIIDDAPIPSVRMLCDVLDNSKSEWTRIESLKDGYSLVYKSLRENPLDVIWREQVMNKGYGKPLFRDRAIGKIKSILKRKGRA